MLGDIQRDEDSDHKIQNLKMILNNTKLEYNYFYMITLHWQETLQFYVLPNVVKKKIGVIF